VLWVRPVVRLLLLEERLDLSVDVDVGKQHLVTLVAPVRNAQSRHHCRACEQMVEPLGDFPCMLLRRRWFMGGQGW
jgi:hypothetical protein